MTLPTDENDNPAHVNLDMDYRPPSIDVEHRAIVRSTSVFRIWNKYEVSSVFERRVIPNTRFEKTYDVHNAYITRLDGAPPEMTYTEMKEIRDLAFGKNSNAYEAFVPGDKKEHENLVRVLRLDMQDPVADKGDPRE